MIKQEQGEPEHSPEITIELDSACGPRVTYNRDASAGEIESEIPAGWRADFSGQVCTDNPEFYRAPLVRVGLEIASMLVLSTSHLSRETVDLIEGESSSMLTWGPSFARGEGWIWHANQSVPPADLDACLKLAHDAGCVWVMFDCDGPVVEGLAVYEW